MKFIIILNKFIVKANDVIAIRKMYNESQEVFGLRLGVSRNTIYNYENGGEISKAKKIILTKLRDDFIHNIGKNIGLPEVESVNLVDFNDRSKEELIDLLSFYIDKSSFYKEKCDYLSSVVDFEKSLKSIEVRLSKTENFNELIRMKLQLDSDIEELKNDIGSGSKVNKPSV